MDIDRIRTCPEYNLRSVRRLAARDDPRIQIWMNGQSPFYGPYLKIRNRRLVVRKEFYESLFMIDRAWDALRDWPVLYELGAGHGMVGLFTAALAPHRIQRVIQLDRRCPESYTRLVERVTLAAAWVKPRSRFITNNLAHIPRLRPYGTVAGVHCCGGLTDLVVDAASRANLPFAVVPCCESWSLLPESAQRAPGVNLIGAVHERRMARWRASSYRIEIKDLPKRVIDRTRTARPMATVHSATSPRPLGLLAPFKTVRLKTVRFKTMRYQGRSDIPASSRCQWGGRVSAIARTPPTLSHAAWKWRR